MWMIVLHSIAVPWHVSPMWKSWPENIMAAAYYRGGLALREVLVSCVDNVVDDLDGEPSLSRECRYLTMLKNGLNTRQISGELGLSREHVSRVYRRRALELVTIEFLSVVKSTANH